MMILNERFMKIAIELAKKGIGNVNPNPLLKTIKLLDKVIMRNMDKDMQKLMHLKV